MFFVHLKCVNVCFLVVSINYVTSIEQENFCYIYIYQQRNTLFCLCNFVINATYLINILLVHFFGSYANYLAIVFSFYTSVYISLFHVILVHHMLLSGVKTGTEIIFSMQPRLRLISKSKTVTVNTSSHHCIIYIKCLPKSPHTSFPGIALIYL